MALMKRSNGHWYIRIKVAGKQYWKSLRTKKKPAAVTVARAEAGFWKEIEARTGRSRHISRVSTDIEKAAGRFLEWLMLNRAERYYERSCELLNHAIKHLGGRTLQDWTRDKIERYLLDGLSGTGWAEKRKRWSHRTSNMHLDQIGRFFRWCMKREYATHNPAADIEKARVEKHQPVFHTLDEIRDILEACRVYDEKRKEAGRSVWLERGVSVALGTGARIEELASITWPDVDLKNNRVRLIPGKSRRGRTVPLAGIARKAFLAVPEKKRKGRIFPELKNRHNGSLRRALKAAELNHCGWHSFRHDYISYLLIEGVPLTIVKELAGHADISTTMRYAHLSKDHIDAAPAKLPF
jgi:integrase